MTQLLYPIPEAFININIGIVFIVDILSWLSSNFRYIKIFKNLFIFKVGNIKYFAMKMNVTKIVLVFQR